ncbi:type VII secretion target [Couchioplanes azureus]|uniref:type VII secretion target n=1 Tax=Couchioplanes caeruleus TaxID=56438 RepID=UPI0019CC5874|nr:type VII secretion target [Couchioplanes caeruleus]GGQ71039.1 hypothetical protein GCM10010166_46420 [Couchioplanes caeruleus subsp. azureus]
MPDDLVVRPADLMAHARHVEAVADRVAAARQAGQAVRADAGAYGRLCAMVPVMLGALQDVLVKGVADTADGLLDTGGKVHAVAENYEATDRARATELSAIEARL